jgi:protein-glutamine gamma-glutamyltransferase
MGSELHRSLRRVTFVLLALASMATEVADGQDRSLLASLGLALIWVGLAAAVAWWVPAPADGRLTPPRRVILVLLAATAFSFLAEPLSRRWLDRGHPLEVQLIFALRNLGLGLAAFAAWGLCQRLACVVSLFLVLFAVSLTSNPAVLTLLGLYGATGVLWLALVYWKGLERFFVPAETAGGVNFQPGRERLSWLAILVPVALAGSAVGLIALGPQRAAGVLAEWFPTSGGTGGYDPFARGGVNDGDDEVKGQNARSTGMVETDSFLDSPLPTLYDMVSDLYGEPFKPRDRERSIALSGRSRPRETDRRPSDSLRPSREFSTARQGPRQPRDSSDRAARALFEVRGRTPLHVRVAAFDTFDGVRWAEAPFDPNTCLVEKEPDSCWMNVRERSVAPIFAADEEHQFKIAGSLGSLLPVPPHLKRFRVGRVDQPGFFAWGQDRILRLAGRKTPTGIVVEARSRTVDPHLLADVDFPCQFSSSRPEYAALPANLPVEIADLALRWTTGQPRGWARVAAIVEHLRAGYEHDASSHTPAECSEPLADFLLRARRGPDYQFATATALLLRVLGYPTRLVSGFYVSPDHYDSRTGFTPVIKEDLHFWAEVMLPSGDWLVLESTPGYEVLGPKLPWSARVLAGLVAAGSWLWEHGLAASLCLVVLAVLWWKKLELLDGVATALWRLFPGRSWHLLVQRAVWLLERRGRWAGHARLTYETRSAWIRRAISTRAENQEQVQQLILIADWSSYAADIPPPWPLAQVRSVCCSVLDDWTFRRWRKGERI